MDPLSTRTAAPPRVRIPTEPVPGRRPSFPILAAVAPVLASGLIWLLTRSPYVLAFAALGPVVAVAGYLDGLRVRRRDDRTAQRSYVLAREQARDRISEEHAQERRAAWSAGPGARAILGGDVAADARWRGASATAAVVVGAGVAASALQIDGGAEDPLAHAAHRLEDAPLRCAITDGIGIHGDASLARAYARSLLVQLAHELPPNALRIRAPEAPEWAWVAALPHPSPENEPLADSPILTIGDAFIGPLAPAEGRGPILIIAAAAGELPPECRCVVRIEGPRDAVVVGRRGRGVSEAMRIELASVHEATAFAAVLAEAAPASDRHTVPTQVPLRALLAPSRAADARNGLDVVVGIGSEGPVRVDLVQHGPHAIVGGTSGSGKSEFLTAWVLALAARFSPEHVTFLLADFKGGATFAALTDLPHCLGTITDLAPEHARRAFRSLSAELRRRERRLAELGVKDVTATAPHGLARLVVVVDECAFLLEQAPELHGLFADIAARGRSLGVHLVLCTQRPAGVVRDAVAANCGLRISLRVNDVADSRLVVGSDAAARIPLAAPGRFVLSRGEGPILVQGALAADGDLVAAVRADDDRAVTHRPWQDPLPDRIALPARTIGPVAEAQLGVVDRPNEQRQDSERLGPGNLLVLGARAAGKSGVIAALAAQCPRDAILLDATTPEAAWDVLTLAAAESLRGAADLPPVILVDDLDLLLRRFAPEQQRVMLEALTTVVRAFPSSGRSVIASAQRLSDGLTALQSLFGRTLALRLPSKQEHQLAAIEGPFDAHLPPAAGWWGGERIQVYVAPEAGVRTAVTPNSVDLDTVPFGRVPVAVVAARPDAALERLRSRGAVVAEVTVPEAERSPSAALVGAVEQWHVARARLDAARSRGAVLFDGVAPAEIRALLGARVVIPYCSEDPPTLILRDGRIDRVLAR